MWDKLLGLLKDTYSDDEIPASIAKREARRQELARQIEPESSSEKQPDGRSTLIGYNYLKGLDGDYEDSSKHIRRFINLNKLLRGKYNGKIEASTTSSESDIRGEDSE